MKKANIKNLTFEELQELFLKLKQPKYRAKQVFSWVYQKGVDFFGEMKNLPAGLTAKLEQDFKIDSLTLADQQKARDKTEKILFRLKDNNFIETVLIQTQNRTTICLSTQVGCKYKCLFCASGSKGFFRNLKSAEIVGQILFSRFKLKHRITNYVFMGMGEPLDNYENVAQAIKIMNHKQGLDIGARRITVSTCGLIPGIKKLQKIGLQINLSVSLHAVTNQLRDILLPVNKRYPLPKLIEACKEFVNKTGRIITLEYILIKGKNDSLKDALGLEKIALDLGAKVNLIPYSSVPGFDFQAPELKDIKEFAARLGRIKTKLTLRQSKGAQIEAACGQLAGKLNSAPKRKTGSNKS